MSVNTNQFARLYVEKLAFQCRGRGFVKFPSRDGVWGGLAFDLVCVLYYIIMV